MRWSGIFLGSSYNLLATAVSVSNPVGLVGSHAPLPTGFPGFLPGYMRDNVNNEYGTAPDKGLFNGPLLGPISPVDASQIRIQGIEGTYLWSSLLEKKNISNSPPDLPIKPRTWKAQSRASGSYWLESLGSKGVMPLAASNFTFFRNVMDYGAKGDGTTDDTAAINKAASDGKVCGKACGSTTVYASVVYFPPGIYLVSSPIIQYYHQQFIGDPNDPPTLQSSFHFTGIAVVDSDVYLPGGNGAEWYINQSNFYRSVQNINFDLTKQATRNFQNGQIYTPTGIHWQPAQGTSITNCAFTMSGNTAVGILMENGSGGFMADLSFTGGNAGMVVGNQQFTFRNLSFKQCLQAVSVIWNWGMVFENVYIESCQIGFNATAHGGPTDQGTGSLSIIDSHFNGVPQGITIAAAGVSPNLVLENLYVESSNAVVEDTSGKMILQQGSGVGLIQTWALGGAYLNTTGVRTQRSGSITPSTIRPNQLLDENGRYFARSKPLYANVAPVVATENGVSNDNSGDQTKAINSLLAANVGKVVFFPAGIYLVKGTIFIPKGSMIIGSGFSQIMGTGSYFQDKNNPKVMVKVGNRGDTGIVEIQDFLFTVRGPTAGCILVEWNIAESSQGSAAMWNSNFRVGGAAGSDLQVADCQGAAPNGKCDAAALLLHLTPGSSAYLENVWAWVADHDLDNPGNANTTEGLDGIPQNVNTNVNIYAGRGMLIESKGPNWFWATASEHNELYNYQLVNAASSFFSHMQTESPYYQPESSIGAFAYQPGKGNFAMDPTFAQCTAGNCLSAWAFRLLNSSQITVYTSGFYSFFNKHVLGCGNQQDCQEHLIETNYVGGLYYYNIFTYGAVEIVSPAGNIIPPIVFNDSNQNGYTSEVAAFLELADSSASNLGTSLNGRNGSGIVYIGPQIWTEPQPSRTVDCLPPCTLVLPPLTLSTSTTISFPPWTTTLVVGWTTTVSHTTSGAVITSSYSTSVTQTTILSIPPVTTAEIPIWNVPIPSNVTSTTIYPTSSVMALFIVVTDNPNPLSQSGVSHAASSRTIYPPPWPWFTSTSSHDPHLPYLTFGSGLPMPTCISGCGKICQYACHPCNPIAGVCKLTNNCCTPADLCTTSCPSGVEPPDSPSESESLTCSKTTQYPSCRETILVVESIYTDIGGAAATTTETKTESVCETITACSGAGTTQITTEATTTTIEDFCEPTNCGAACVENRALPTSVTSIPTAQAKHKARKAPIEIDLTARKPKFLDIDKYHFNRTNAHVTKRNLPPPGTGDWSDFYGPIMRSADTDILDNNDGKFGTGTSLEVYELGGFEPINIVIQGLYGCFSVIIVSHQGVLVTHHWETPDIRHNMQFGVIDPLNTILNESANIYFSSSRASIFLMVGASKAFGDTDQEAIDSLSQSWSAGPRYTQQVGQITAALNDIFPNIQPYVFTYARQVNTDIREGDGAWGKAAILFEPDQTVDPNSGNSLPANTAFIQVYLEAYQVLEEAWPYIKLQVWRVNAPASNGSPAANANVLKTTDMGEGFNPCEGGLVPPPPVEYSKPVARGSTDISMNVPNQEFDIKDANGNIVETGCVFTGSGMYAPTAASGFIAGTLTCSGGYSVNCDRPFDNSATTTCGHGDVSTCGTLGANCDTYYQLLATCRY